MMIKICKRMDKDTRYCPVFDDTCIVLLYDAEYSDERCICAYFEGVEE